MSNITTTMSTSTESVQNGVGSRMIDFPTEVQFMICSYLRASDLKRVIETSRYFHCLLQPELDKMLATCLSNISLDEENDQLHLWLPDLFDPGGSSDREVDIWTDGPITVKFKIQDDRMPSIDFGEFIYSTCNWKLLDKLFKTNISGWTGEKKSLLAVWLLHDFIQSSHFRNPHGWHGQREVEFVRFLVERAGPVNVRHFNSTKYLTYSAVELRGYDVLSMEGMMVFNAMMQGGFDPNYEVGCPPSYFNDHGEQQELPFSSLGIMPQHESLLFRAVKNAVNVRKQYRAYLHSWPSIEDGWRDINSQICPMIEVYEEKDFQTLLMPIRYLVCMGATIDPVLLLQEEEGTVRYYEFSKEFWRDMNTVWGRRRQRQIVGLLPGDMEFQVFGDV